MKLITKVILLIVSLMTPVIALYALSHRQSTAIVEEQITIANQNRLAIFMQQIEGTMEQVSQYSSVIAQDPDFAKLAGNVIPTTGYDYAVLLDTLQDKLKLFSTSTAWMNRINIYFPSSASAVSSYSLIPYDEMYLRLNAAPRWAFRTVHVDGLGKRAFSRFFIEPPSATADLTKATMIVEVDLMADNIVSLLDSFKTKGNNDPFLYKSKHEYVLNTSADRELIRELIQTGMLGWADWSEGGHVVALKGERYLVYGLTSDELRWTLVDYIPLDEILTPVTYSRNLFFATAGLLVLMGAGAAYLIYSQVQVPIRMLRDGAERLERGELSVRVSDAKHGDFARLIRQFNRMAAKMQHLIEKVYSEELRAKEAVMKQLQSQINPHFLYNSLAYIVSMAQMKRVDPVITMAYSLADYYRYTTRSDRMVTTVREEIAFVKSYIEIMDMQLNKIDVRIDIPEALEPLVIPRLLFQPIAENAIAHGLEPKMGPGAIVIEGRAEAGIVRFRIADDGVGMTEDELERLNETIRRPASSGDSFGLWNVHQRLVHRYGPEAGLAVCRSAMGGVEVWISWPLAAEGEEGEHGSGTHRRRS
ncbi:sensor histidine kinase [Paenibacillus sp.]|uniref:sensor histidine kinase n=1 Tax=Paenibacillus sp. TaxID=58172 RepID=UPI002D4DE9AC|nr:sensor histidine kinase [Paenibacillus sp.]HZG85691.1 sensor histidine kinase [Paenibacillus sp.]